MGVHSRVPTSPVSLLYWCLIYQMEKRSVFSERSTAAPYANSDDEEDGYNSPNIKRRGASVDDFLKGSELGKQVTSLTLKWSLMFQKCFITFSSLLIALLLC